MNNALKKIILLLYSLMITYITASLIVWDLNISHWSTTVRFIWIIFSFLIFVSGVKEHKL
jgi:hypothetical protein